MTDTTTAPAAAPAAPAASADEVAALRAEIAALTKAITVQPAAPAAAPAGPGVAKIVWGAGVRAWWASFEATVRAGSFLSELLAGLKTLLVFSVTGALALLQEFNAIDLTPLVSAVLPANAKLDVAGVITLMSVLGILLRLVTKSAIFRKAKDAAAGATDSKVDEPVN